MLERAIALLYRYELVVESCDRGEEPCCVNTTVTVNVVDVNDNKPVINNIDETCISVLEVRLHSAPDQLCE